MDNNL